jgi:cob(I)alamin adenosyltransferase
MARLTKIYTRTGDDGTTGLGGGTRVRKDHLQVAAYGDVDETNSAIGVAIATGLGSEVSELLSRVQNELFNVGGVLCLLGEPVERKPLIEARHIAALEQACDRFNASLSPLANFVLPGGSPQAAALHLARTVCRRAERTVVALAQIREVPSELIRYLNRCSDLLFILARYENSQRGAPDQLWDSSV